MSDSATRGYSQNEHICDSLRKSEAMQKLKPSQSLTNLTSFDSTRLSASTAEYKWFKSAVREAHSTIVPPSDERVKLGNFAVRVSNGFCISLSVIDGLKSTAGQVAELLTYIHSYTDTYNHIMPFTYMHTDMYPCMHTYIIHSFY